MNYKREFIKFAMENGALKFGEFTLKSGRLSPYFFNAGVFDSGSRLGQLASFYAMALEESSFEIDGFFGPAYKGIPLAVAIALEFDRNYGEDMAWAFDRKEAKNHGDGGATIGSFEPNMVIVDDVITAGTSVRNSIAVLKAKGSDASGVIVCLDRQEIGTDTDKSAIQQIEEMGIPVVSIIKLDDILEFVRETPEFEQHAAAIVAYREKYGA